jgi:hypothetical protein
MSDTGCIYRTWSVRGDQTVAGEGILGLLPVLNCSFCEDNSAVHTYYINFYYYVSFQLKSFKSQGVDHIPAEFI